MKDALRAALRLAVSLIASDRAAPARSPRPPLGLEELETRSLMSASALSLPGAAPNFNATPLAQAASAPYTPTQIRHAYGFDKLPYDGSGQTIAIVEAYDDPKIQSDLHTFDAAFGLADPSFTKAKPNGAPATANAAWSGETDLDVEWAHAIAPKAKILLVESLSSGDGDLRNAVDYARRQPGVVAVSMSWGGSEWSGELGYDSTFSTPSGHAGVAFVASAGDSGAGAQWPAVSPNVLAVGGTSLTVSADGTRISEAGWGSGGGGLSRYESEPSFQRSAQSSGKRSTPDVAYNADTNTGYYVYVGVPDASGQSGWYSYGGTSAGAPQWAALIALADQGRAQAGFGSLSNIPTAIYSLARADFNDVAIGSNGNRASAGYDLVTGLGTPKANQVVADLVHYGVAAPAARKVVSAKPVAKPAAKKAAPAKKVVKPAAKKAAPAKKVVKPAAKASRADLVIAELLHAMHGPHPHQTEADFEAVWTA